MLLIFCLILFKAAVPVFAQDEVVYIPQSEEFKIHFEFDKSSFNPSFKDNRAEIGRMFEEVDRLGVRFIDSIIVISQSSPEGVYEHNIMLSRKRASSMKSYIAKSRPEVAHLLKMRNGGEAWDDLREIIASDPKLSDKSKEKALAIIDSDINIGTKKWRMAQLPVYRYLLATHYRNLRQSALVIVYSKPQIVYGETVMAEDSISCEEIETVRCVSQNEQGKQMHKEFRVMFRADQIEIEEGYLGNAQTLSQIRSYIENCDSNDYKHLVKIAVYGATSPEGSNEWNRHLEEKRQQALVNYILKYCDIPNERIEFGENRVPFEILKSQVAGSDIAEKEKVLEIIEQESDLIQYYINSNGDRLSRDSRVEQMKRLTGAWNTVIKSSFPLMRYASVTIVTEDTSKPITVLNHISSSAITSTAACFANLEHSAAYSPIEVPQMQKSDTEDCYIIEGKEKKERGKNIWIYKESPLTVKTNGIGWLMLIANGALEWHFTERWSYNFPFYYSGGVNYFTDNIKFRGIVFQPELRYYFKKVDGLYAGPHLGIGWYNFALNGDYRIQDANGIRPAIGGGVGVGYRYHIPHLPHWGLEFNLGVGVYNAVYDKFYNEPNGPLAEAGVHKTFVGIDNATVSITYNLGHRVRIQKANKR